MIVPPKGGARKPWLGVLTLVVLVVVFALRQLALPHAPAPRDTAAPAPPPSASVDADADAGSGTRTAAAGHAKPGAGFRSSSRWQEHWAKHGREFASLGIHDADAYLAAAQDLRDRPAGGPVLEQSRADGVITRFDRQTGAFLAFDRDGTIRTFFRPNDGEAYFHRQAQREH